MRTAVITLLPTCVFAKWRNAESLSMPNIRDKPHKPLPFLIQGKENARSSAHDPWRMCPLRISSEKRGPPIMFYRGKITMTVASQLYVCLRIGSILIGSVIRVIRFKTDVGCYSDSLWYNLFFLFNLDCRDGSSFQLRGSYPLIPTGVTSFQLTRGT